MNWKKTLVLIFFLITPFSLDAQENSSLAPKLVFKRQGYFQVAFNVLKDLIYTVNDGLCSDFFERIPGLHVNTPPCPLNSGEKYLFKKLYSNLEDESKGEGLIFLEESEYAHEFLINGEMKLATTSFENGNAILINLDLLNRLNEFSFTDALHILIHELLHHVTRADEGAIDFTTSKVVSFYKNYIKEEDDYLLISHPYELIAHFSPTSVLYLFNGTDWINLTPKIISDFCIRQVGAKPDQLYFPRVLIRKFNFIKNDTWFDEKNTKQFVFHGDIQCHTQYKMSSLYIKGYSIFEAVYRKKPLQYKGTGFQFGSCYYESYCVGGR